MAALCLLALAQEVFHPQVELTRKEKKVVAWVRGEEGSLFYADYGDLLVGELQALSPERVQVENRAFFRDLGSAVEEGLKVGERVEVAYNPDWEQEGLPYLMRLRRAGEGKGERYLRLVLFDPKGVEELFLSGGEARYLEEEGRLELRPAPGKVAVAQGQVWVEGQRLRYQNDTGEALLEGPLEVRREGEKPLSGKAGSLRYLLDEDRLWLLGGVELTQGGRTTRAERALLREKEGYAFLYGKVESRDERGVVRGERVRYALKTGEVVVLGGVAGEFRGD
ncbi:hypothetical protein CSW29_09155 [Thermus scotoductus]|uniref:OstA family protein n=2 Tax=Thermus scotoductus TaxID=37636 RepID=A0A430UFT3_THESC|nr:hypothetical protein [Thermus scotoductus]RTH98699.1 hypothetical protein CSW29_09155 [Thermus scotoductus]